MAWFFQMTSLISSDGAISPYNEGMRKRGQYHEEDRLEAEVDHDGG